MTKTGLTWSTMTWAPTMTNATPPGPARKWVEMLDSPWDEDPEVVVVMVPNDAKIQVRQTMDEACEFLCVQTDEGLLGLQVIKPEMDTYSEHNMAFRHLGGRMLRPAHFGRLSNLPQKFLQSTDFKALVFNKDHMCHEFLDLLQAGTLLASLGKASN